MVSRSGQRSGLLKTPHGSDYFLLCWSSTQTEPILTTWAQRHRVIRPGEPCFYIPAVTTLSAETHTLHTTRREEKGKTKDKEQVWERGFLQRDPKHAITLQWQWQPKITNMQVFPFPLKANGVWYPVGILAHVFHLTIYPDIFHIELIGKKCSEEFELEFFQAEDTSRGTERLELSEIPHCLMMSRVSEKPIPSVRLWHWREPWTWVNTLMWFGGLAPADERGSSSQSPPPDLHIVTSTSRTEEETERCG